MVYYNFVFVALPIGSIGYDNSELSKVIYEILQLGPTGQQQVICKH